jgi:hypothetical protein
LRKSDACQFCHGQPAGDACKNKYLARLAGGPTEANNANNNGRKSFIKYWQARDSLTFLGLRL